jgi:hypothetical protein
MQGLPIWRFAFGPASAVDPIVALRGRFARIRQVQTWFDCSGEYNSRKSSSHGGPPPIAACVFSEVTRQYPYLELSTSIAALTLLCPAARFEF